MADAILKKRSTIGACLLSLFFSGLGQIYNGSLKKGILIFAVEIVLAISSFLIFLGTFTGFVIFFIAAILFRIACITDAAISARRAGEFQLKKYNRWYYYLIYICLLYLSSEMLINFIVPNLNYRSFVVPTSSMENTIFSGDYLCVEKAFNKDNQPKRGDLIVFIFPGNRDQLEAPELQWYMKRCVAVAGDTLLIVNKQVFVNGMESKLPEYGKLEPVSRESEYAKLHTFPVGAGFTPNNYGPLRIPKKGDTIYLNHENFRAWEVFIKREQHKIEMDDFNISIDRKPARYYVVEHDYCFGIGDNRDNSLDSRFFGFIPVEKVFGKPIFVYWSYASGYNDIGYKDSYIRWNRIGKSIK